MASVNNIFKYEDIIVKFWSPQSCSTRISQFHNLSPSELGNYIYMLEVALTLGRTSENFAPCFLGYRYQAPADHWENLRGQLFSCNRGRC